MRKLLTIIITFCILISLTGCAKVINVEYQEVEVKVVDEYYREMYEQPMYAGRVITKVHILLNIELLSNMRVFNINSKIKRHTINIKINLDKM